MFQEGVSMPAQLKNKNFIQLYTDGAGIPALVTLAKEKSLAFKIFVYFLYHMNVKNTIIPAITQTDIGKIFNVKKQAVSQAINYLLKWNFIWFISRSYNTRYYVINPNICFRSYMFNKERVPLPEENIALLSLIPYQQSTSNKYTKNLYFDKIKELFSMNKVQLYEYKETNTIFYKEHTGRKTYQNKNFIQLSNDSLPSLATLAIESITATRILLYLVTKMDQHNCTDALTTTEISLACKIAPYQINKALTTLINHHFIWDIKCTKNIKCYLVNPNVFFKDSALVRKEIFFHDKTNKSIQHLPYEMENSFMSKQYLETKRLFKIDLLNLQSL